MSDERWTVTCAYCANDVPGERTRLFWSTEPGNPGTFRICSNEHACQRRAGERARFLRKALDENGGRGVDMAEEIDRLERWHERSFAPGELTERYGR